MHKSVIILLLVTFCIPEYGFYSPFLHGYTDYSHCPPCPSCRRSSPAPINNNIHVVINTESRTLQLSKDPNLFNVSGNGNLTVDPEKLNDLFQNTFNFKYECPEEKPRRACFKVRTISNPGVCYEDKDCQNKGNFKVVCCYDECLKHKTCKPPLIKT